MLSLLEVAERAQKGRRLSSEEWDRQLFIKVSELAMKYEIKCPKEAPFFNLDDALLERALKAAMDFLVDAGIYCVTTGRAIQFAEMEVQAAIKEAPKEIVVGEGRDARVIKQRKVESKEFLNQMPGLHAPFSENIGPLVVMNCAQIPSADYVGGYNCTSVDGREVFGPAMEMYAGRRVVAAQRDAVRKAGRPGMAISCYPLSTRPEVLIALLDPDYGLRRTDGMQLTVMPDAKIELGLITVALACEEYGCFRVNSGGRGLVGGFCGGVEGALIEGLAKTIGGVMVYRSLISVPGTDELLIRTPKSSKVSPKLCWGTSVVCQALNRCTNVICYDVGMSNSGPGTETYLLDLAVHALRAPINGANLFLPRQSLARMNAAQTPLEPEWMWEIANASMKANLDRMSGDEVLRKLAQHLDGRPLEPGQDVSQCYDLVNHRPTPEYAEVYKRTKELMASLGLQFD